MTVLQVKKHIISLKLSTGIYIFSLLTILLLTGSVYGQGRRDWDRGSGFEYQYSDSIDVKISDSLKAIQDSLRRLPVDSTARIKYFTYEGEYSPITDLKEYSHPLLMGNSGRVQYSVRFDSNQVIITETILDFDLKIPLVIPLEEYIKSLSEINQNRIFDEIFRERYQGLVTDDLTQLFEKFTDITIPLPFKTETIFGPPTVSLRINGNIDITASYQNITSDQLVTTQASNTQNNINFKQEVFVTAKGTIGDKLTIDADWNTQRVFDFENQLKIKYEGYADEVIKRIEAGNVSLTTNSGLIQSTQALFGVKGEFQLGPLSLSTVFSQKKSKQETKDFTGGAADQQFTINVFNYSTNHYFIDTLYRRSFLEKYNSTTSSYSTFVIQNRIISDETSLEVWVQAPQTETNKRFAVTHIDLPQLPPTGYDTSYYNIQEIQGVRYASFFRKLTKDLDYEIDEDAGFITLKTNIPQNYAVAITYRTQSGSTFGTPGFSVQSSDTLILKLVKSNIIDPVITPLAWEKMMKNVYRLPVSKIIESGFELKALYFNDGIYNPNLPGATKSLSTMLDIDRYTGNTRTGGPDDQFDFINGLTINRSTGDVIFPTLRPFWDNLIREGVDSIYYYSQLYTNRNLDAQNATNANRYILQGRAKGEAGLSSTINLGLNVVPGSVKVMIGSTALNENIDYSVDYTTGTVVIKNAAALASTDLKITYETNDLFQLAQKTLIGLRGDYKIDENNSLGFTFINLEQKTLNDKVRIGEEPTNNSVFGIDFTSRIKSKWLTRLVNLLPGYNTKEESEFTIKGELAYLTPDPNTKRSEIPSDNNESVAYVDDMEGSKKIVSLGTNYSSWTFSSVPQDNDLGMNDSLRFIKRAKLRWYNLPNAANIKDIYPNRDVQPGQESITPFIIDFDPNLRATYNYSNTYSRGDGIFFPNIERQSNWNGVMKYLNTTSTDLINENINFIEFNIQLDSSQLNALRTGKFVVELGSFSKDALFNRVMDTEDRNGNDILEITEDLGVDYKTDQEELEEYRLISGNITANLTDFPNSDPAGDNNTTGTTFDVDRINGTQDNRDKEGGNRPDTEDLNRTSGSVSTPNVYFSYEIPLDTNNNQFISGRGKNGWVSIRVPLNEYTKIIGNPTLNNIEFARFYLKGLSQRVQFSLYDFNLVGNQWTKPNKSDTTYNISIVSLEETPQIYKSPVPGDVLRQRVQQQSGQSLLSNEASLSLDVFDLVDGERKLAVKDYRSQPLDLFSYRKLKLFVNGDPTFNYTNEKIFDAWMLVRLGTDSLNYYEYRAPIHPDIRPGTPWNSLNEVNIDFADLTAFKILQDSINTTTEFPVPNGPPGSYYIIKGNPLLTSIRQISVGVEKNRQAFNASISGSVWFNEIRVLNIEDNNGYAFNLNAGIKFADFMNLNFNFSKTDPNFHALDGRFGSRRTSQAWDFSGTINVHKFINNALSSLFSEEWKDFLTLPITFRHSESIYKPRYYPGTDIDIEEARVRRYNQILQQTGDVELAERLSNNIDLESQTLDIRNELGIQGMRFQFPSNNYFVKNFINRFAYNITATFGSSRDVTYEKRNNFDVRGSVDFVTDFGLMENLNLNIGRLFNLGDNYKEGKIYLTLPFLPLAPLFSNNFNASTDFTRNREERKQRALRIDDPTSRNFNANRGFGFDWKFIENWIVDLSGNYRFKVGSDLREFETIGDSLQTQRPENQVLDQIFFNNAFINFGKDLDYQQTTTFNPKFNLPFINKFIDFGGNYSVTYGWTNPNTTENIGYNVGYQNNLTANATLKFSEILNIFKGSGNQNPGRLRSASSDTLKSSQNILDIFKVFGTFFPDNVTVAFTQSNLVRNQGVIGRPGFGNFWISPTTKEEFGPSRFYQLGFSQFPGNRVPGLQVQDNYDLQNEISLTSSISPIFPNNIRMNLTFKKKWGFNNGGSFVTNEQGLLGTQTSKSSSNSNSISIFFPGDIENFNYVPSANSTENINNITEAFKSNVSSFPFPNWSLTISGVEKFPLFAQFAQSVSIDNAYNADFLERYSIDLTSSLIPQQLSITKGFNPLFGMNITFKETFGGNLNANFRISSTATNSLFPASSLIQTTKTNDLSINATFTKSGFEIPLFGLSLQNDISFSVTYSKTNNTPVDFRYSVNAINNRERLPGNGSVVTTFNPAIQYSLSQKVQMQLFYKYIRTEPTENTAATIPRTSNEGGLNIRISIQ